AVRGSAADMDSKIVSRDDVSGAGGLAADGVVRRVADRDSVGGVAQCVRSIGGGTDQVGRDDIAPSGGDDNPAVIARDDIGTTPCQTANRVASGSMKQNSVQRVSVVITAAVSADEVARDHVECGLGVQDRSQRGIGGIEPIA